MARAANATKGRAPAKRTVRTTSSRANLTLNAARGLRFLRAGSAAGRVARASKVYVTAAYEALLERVLGETLKLVRPGAKRVRASDVMRGITEGEVGLRELFDGHAYVVGGGLSRVVVPRADEKHAHDVHETRTA